MKRIFILLTLQLAFNLGFAQNKEGAEKLVGEGVTFHDKGEYDKAISKYDQALELDKDNLLALVEKAYSLTAKNQFDEAISYCQKAIEIHPGSPDLETVYVTYGSVLDVLKKPEEAIAIYEQGIKQFPNFYLLHFNKGITLSGMKKYDEALLDLQKAVQLNPKHPGSHNAIARISFINDKNIPALLAYSRFFTLEPQSNRAKENLGSVQTIMKGNVQKTGKKSVTINIDASMFADTTANGQPKENSFTSTNMILTLSSAMDFDKKNKKETEVKQFIRKFETVCSSLAESKKDNYGFFWEYYAPYFIEMKEKNQIETFAYLVYATSEDKATAKWLKSHETEIDSFFAWSKTYDWKAKR